MQPHGGYRLWLKMNLCTDKPRMEEMVEAAGVEPASEEVTGQEPTYVVAFRKAP